MQATRLGGKLLVVTMLVAGTGIVLSASHRSLKQDTIGIERLHGQDRDATLSDSADQLAKLWDKEAIRFPMGRPAEIGAAVIYADDKEWEMSSGRERTLCYDMEVQDIQIAGDWAFEWAYFSGKSAKADKVSIFNGKVMRTVRRNAEVRKSHGSARPVGICCCVEASLSVAIDAGCCQWSKLFW